VQAAIRALAGSDAPGGASFTRQEQRQADGLTIQTYAIDLHPPAPAKEAPAAPSLVQPVLSVLLKYAVLETAVDGNTLVTVVGPRGTIETQRPSLAPNASALNRKIAQQNPALTEPLAFGGSLRLADLLRHAVSIIPEIKPEQVRLLPRGGDGFTFGISLSGPELTASLRFQSGEIAALQRLNRDGRAVLQEVVFQMFAKQLMEQQKIEKEE
ncbi:MAG: hypothetical protein LBW77_05085, partial [Verrucomicrobiota bacterium]|nr:hypothetical protein [Verrucomicrobiota bacterium]